MAIEPDDASAALSDVAKVELRTRQAVRHWVSSQFLIMWGVLTATGYVVEFFRPDFGWYTWAAVMIGGVSGGFAIIFSYARRVKRKPRDMQILYAMFAFIAYGILWTRVFGHFDPRQLNAFWPTVFMLGFVVAGFWVGRFFIWCGLTVTAAIVAGYFWTGDWFYLWLAATEGIGLIAGGLYLRRIGVEQ